MKPMKIYVKFYNPHDTGTRDFANIVLYKMYTVCSTVTGPASPNTLDSPAMCQH